MDNRYLAWIWVDDVLLQNLLVEQGLAETYMLQNNYKYAGMLQESEEDAKNNKLGIWSNVTDNILNSENKSQILVSKQEESKVNHLIFIIIGITIIIISKISITYNKRKRK